MTAFILFLSTFLLVFGLGLQSLNVNSGLYRSAFFTSFLIGSMQMITLKLGPNANWLEIAGYLSGGPFGIISSMFFHKHYKVWIEKKREATSWTKDSEKK